jgi:thiamine-phosphate pyrophosphorylase
MLRTTRPRYRTRPLRDRLARARLYLLATAAVSRLPLMDAVAAAIDGGVDVVQLREKTMEEGAFLELADDLRLLCAAKDVLFIVNDRVEAARLVGADGVHLGQDDVSVAEARRMLGTDALIGVSTHDATELACALGDGADYVGVGSVFATSTKGRDVLVSGPAALAALAAKAEAAGVPAFAIGGITAANVGEVVAAGFRRVAVCAGILASDDAHAAARAIRGPLDSARPGGYT